MRIHRTRLTWSMVAVALLLTTLPGSAQRVGVLDVGHGSVGEGSFPHSFTRVGDDIYFAAFAYGLGWELWKTDGTGQGTRLVRDVAPGSEWGLDWDYTGLPLAVARFGETVFFRGFDPEAGNELWKTDGTPLGTRRVVDLTAGANGTEIGSIAATATRLVFSDGSTTWTSDGTAEGTRVLINSGAGLRALNGFLYFSSSSQLKRTDGTEVTTIASLPGLIERMNVVNGQLYLSVSVGSSPYELWKSDGTASGTQRIATLGSMRITSPFVAAGTAVYFTDEKSLWKTDGTSEGTARVKDFSPGGIYLHPNLTASGAFVFFNADTSETGVELWRSDGTATGTIPLEVVAGSGSSQPTLVAPVPGGVVFTPTFGGGGGLWFSDGASAVRIHNVSPLGFQGFPAAIRYGDRVLFAGSDLNYGTELWETDGTAAGTRLVINIYPDHNLFPGNLVASQNALFFSASSTAEGIELWSSDGTVAGTRMVKDISPGVASSEPIHLTTVGSRVVMTAHERLSGREVWGSDGTTTGTVLLRDFVAGSQSLYGPFIFPPFRLFGDRVYFRAFDSQSGHGLWKSDGTSEGTEFVADLDPGTSSTSLRLHSAAAVHQGFLFIGLDDGLWRTDGTTSGTVKVSDRKASALVSAGETLFFLSENALWRLTRDTGPQEIKQVIQATPATSLRVSFALPLAEGVAVYAFDDNVYGVEPWITDGTSAGTHLIRNIRPGGESSIPVETYTRTWARLGNAIVFIANDGEYGYELWRTNGTEAGTFMLGDLFPGEGPSWPKDFFVDGDRLYFQADDGIHGRELWITDGTIAGTKLLLDLWPGFLSSAPVSLTRFQSRIWFSAVDELSGSELRWLEPATVSRRRPARR